ncbi:HAD family hydrolase [uncultured Fusobacterium sp.]|mgnify:FL=1|uniref:HAD family hydrolase n=1 Tax=uncultured Fusobacterium sp. TaxID=159267 RepID=UPI00258CEDAF|nr:HAD family hydrolase [uncultured Fusobacterium sp.]
MIKLIITDMDGTLLNNYDEIDPEFWEIEKKLSEKGVIFSIASGRPYYNLVKKFEKIKDNLLFICENGSLAIYKGKELFSNPISIENIKMINEICNKIPGIITLFCGKKFAYTYKDLFLANTLETQNEIRKYYNNLQLVDTLEDINDQFVKIAIYDPKGSENNSYQILKKYSNQFQIVVSGKVWLDLSNIGTNKGIAILTIQEKLNISYDETMAFGDYLNDYEMMKNVKYSYAMKNAHPDLISISNFITKEDNDHGGVTNTIKEIFNL